MLCPIMSRTNVMSLSIDCYIVAITTKNRNENKTTTNIITFTAIMIILMGKYVRKQRNVTVQFISITSIHT